MDKLYFALLLAAFVILLFDALVAGRRTNEALAVRLLPLALALWILVPLLQVGDRIF